MKISGEILKKNPLIGAKILVKSQKNKLSDFLFSFLSAAGSFSEKKRFLTWGTPKFYNTSLLHYSNCKESYTETEF